MASVKVRRGRCSCGRVTFRLSGDPIFTNNCYCEQCQRQTGSTSIVNACYESWRVELLAGHLRETFLKTGSRGEQIVYSCDKCCVAVWSHYPRMGRRAMAVRVGALVDARDIVPDACIFVSEKPDWVSLPEKIPAFDKGYEYRDVLDHKRFRRLQDILG